MNQKVTKVNDEFEEFNPYANYLPEDRKMSKAEKRKISQVNA